MGPYEADPRVEINTTVAEDEEMISIHPPMREMEEPQIFKCSKCGESFPLLSELSTHNLRCPKSRNKFSCSLCGIKFSTDFGCNYHEFHVCLKMGDIDNKFKCQMCGADFYIEENFKIHEREVCRRGGIGEDAEHGVGRGVEADVGGGERQGRLGRAEFGGNLGGAELGGDLGGGDLGNLGGGDVECQVGGEMEEDVGGGEMPGDVQGEEKEDVVGGEGGGDRKKENLEKTEEYEKEEMKEDLEKIEKEEMKEKKEERQVKKEEEQEKEEEGEWEMCTKCLEIEKNVHKSVDCMAKQIINAGCKLAVHTKSQNLKKMLVLIDMTEEERCPVCQGDAKIITCA